LHYRCATRQLPQLKRQPPIPGLRFERRIKELIEIERMGVNK